MQYSMCSLSLGLLERSNKVISPNNIARESLQKNARNSNFKSIRAQYTPEFPIKIVSDAEPIFKQVIILIIIGKRVWPLVFNACSITLSEIVLHFVEKHKRNTPSSCFISNNKENCKTRKPSSVTQYNNQNQMRFWDIQSIIERFNTKCIVDEEVEGVSITRVGELAAIGRKLLQALHGNGAKVSRERRVLRQNNITFRDKTINQPFVTHL